MIARKNVGRASPFLLVLLAFGFFLGTYNLLILVMHKGSRSATEELSDPIISRPDELRGGGAPKFHVALTATDAPYSKWQCRVMYYWYKKMKDQPGSDMGGFTRVLHSGNPDNLMEEIPTVVTDPLPEGLDRVSSDIC